VRIISSIPTEAGKRHFNGLELSAQRLAFELVVRGNPVDKPPSRPFQLPTPSAWMVSVMACLK